MLSSFNGSTAKHTSHIYSHTHPPRLLTSTDQRILVASHLLPRTSDLPPELHPGPVLVLAPQHVHPPASDAVQRPGRCGQGVSQHDCLLGQGEGARGQLPW